MYQYWIQTKTKRISIFKDKTKHPLPYIYSPCLRASILLRKVEAQIKKPQHC